MEKKFEIPELTIVQFAKEDIIVTSLDDDSRLADPEDPV